MGRDYSAQLAVGFLTLAGELEAPFTKEMPAKTHNVIRYNEKTGQPFIKEIVEEPAGERTVFEEEDLTGDPLQLAELVACKLTEMCGFDVDHHWGGDMYEGQHEFVFGLKHEYDTDASMNPWQFVSHTLATNVETLRAKMKELGLKPDFYRIHCLSLIT